MRPPHIPTDPIPLSLIFLRNGYSWGKIYDIDTILKPSLTWNDFYLFNIGIGLGKVSLTITSSWVVGCVH